MLLNNRHGSVDSDAYRYGFNGQERDDEVKGEGNSYDYGSRMYDNRIGRWFAPDNVKKPWLSQYQFSSNDPIDFVDLDGNDEIHFYYKIREIWNADGSIGQELQLASEIIENDSEHTFFMHNISQEVLSDKYKPVQFYPFDENHLPNQGSTAASDANLPLSGGIHFAYFFNMSLSDYAYLGTLLNYAPELDDHYSVKHDDHMRFKGAKNMARSAEFTQDLATAQEFAYDVVGGFQILKTGGKFLLRSKFVQKQIAQTTVKIGAQNVDNILIEASKSQRVGQWMTPKEYNQFIETGNIPRTNVLTKGKEGWMKQADVGDYYIEFDVNPKLLMSKNVEDGWSLVKSKNATQNKLAQNRGQPLPAPTGSNIEHVATKSK